MTTPPPPAQDGERERLVEYMRDALKDDLVRQFFQKEFLRKADEATDMLSADATQSAELAALRQKAETDQIALQMYKQLSDEQLDVIAALRAQVEEVQRITPVSQSGMRAVLESFLRARESAPAVKK
jgi:hypothetical protein